MTTFIPFCCPFEYHRHHPKQTCRWIHKPERQWFIYPTCTQTFQCMTMKQVSLARAMLQHICSPSVLLKVHKPAGAHHCHCQHRHHNNQPEWLLSISKVDVPIKPHRKGCLSHHWCKRPPQEARGLYHLQSRQLISLETLIFKAQGVHLIWLNAFSPWTIY